MSDNTQTVPGLQVWGIFAIAALALVAWITSMPTPDERADSSIRKYIVQHNKPDPKTPLVLILGSSLTACGLEDVPVLENKFFEKYGYAVRVMKIWKLTATPEFFTNMSTQLKQLHPKIIVMEGNIFLYTSQKNKWWSQAPLLFKDYVDKINKDSPYNPDFKPALPQRTVSELQHLRTGVTGVSQLRDFAQLFARFQKDSCKIILLNYPLENELEERKWNSADTAIFFNNLRFLRSVFGFTYKDAKTRLNENYFIDHGHMNANGRHIQTNIFCKEVADQLELQ